MNARDDWPLPAETPEWWANWAALTDAQKDAMREEYEREQIASAQSEQDTQAWAQNYSKR